MESFIKASAVKFKYEKQEEKLILDDISLSINPGEFVAILGHNGCGKSTLAKHFNALLSPSSGTIFIDGINSCNEEKTYDIRKNVGLVLQNPDNQIVASIVEEDVAFGPENLGIAPLEIRKRVDDALKCVGMYEYKDHASYKLSGGQKQKIAIAGILAMHPKCIVLDEPTAMLDPLGRNEVIETIKKLNKEKKITIILITHFMEEAVMADRVIVMDQGKILLDSTPKKVFSEVDLLKQHGLDVPQSVELLFKLKKSGLTLDIDALSLDQCVCALEKILKEKVK